MDYDRGQLYLMLWCPLDRKPEFETSYLEQYGKVFATEVRIQGYEYMGRGVSATPEGSKNNAAIHYLMHLIRDGMLDKRAVAKKVPCLPLGVHPDGTFDPSPLPRFLEPVTDDSFGNDSHDMTVAYSSVSNQDTGGTLSSVQERQGYNATNRDPRLRSSLQEYVPLQVLVPKHAIQNVIGADGSVIKRIEANNGVKITLSGKSKNNDSEDRIFTLIGESDKVQAAALTINKIIQWSLVRAANSLQQVMVSYDQNSSSAIHVEPSGTCSSSAAVNSRTVESTQVRAANSLQQVMVSYDQNSSSAIHVEPSGTCSSSAAVNSRTAESTQQKHGSMLPTVQQIQRSATAIAPSTVTSMKISLPVELVGLAVGLGGANVKRIKEEIGADIKIDDKVDDKGCRSCEITGTQESIAAAVREINLIIRGNGQKISNVPTIYQQARGSVTSIATMKISIPQELVGLAIGAGGVNCKRVEAETGVKLTFDQKLDDNGCKSCEVTGTSESIAAAVKKINLIIRGDGQKTGNLPSINQQAEGSVTVPKLVSSKKLPVPKEFVGLVIGIGGATVKRIKEATGATNIQFEKTADDKGCKMCEIVGTPESIEAAVNEINNIVGVKNKDTEAKVMSQENNKTVELNTGNLSSTIQQIEVPVVAPKSVSSRKLSVPKEFVGLVIGLGGANVKRIKEATGVTNIQFEKIADDKGCKTCKIDGKPESIEAAVKEINSIIGVKDDTEEATAVSQENRKSVEIPIPEEVFQFVTGKQNATISHIATKAGVAVSILNRKITDTAGIRKCVISGKPDGVESAARRVNALINIGVRNAKSASSLAEHFQTPQSGQPSTVPQQVNTFSKVEWNGISSHPVCAETPQAMQPNTVLQNVDTSSKLEILVPAEMVECVKGKDGAIINQISKDTGTLIILDESEKNSNFGISKCLISGPPPNILTAARRINALINVGVVTKIIPSTSQQPSILPISVIDHSFQQDTPSSSIIGQLAHMANKAPAPQENAHRMNIIDELQQKLSKNQEKNKTVLPKPQRNWYRMAISSSHIQSFKGYDFVLEPSLEREIDNALAAMNVVPKVIDKNSTFSLKPKLNLSPGKTIASQPDIVMRWWSPPQKNWDPWLNKNIDEPPLSEMSLEQISSHLTTAHFSLIQNDEKLQNNIKGRKSACIRLYQHEILHRIKTNPVTIIHGPSGCGKSTQVPQYIFDSYLGLEHAAECCILVTQPRDITVITTAKHIAKERCEEMGNSIGFEVAFQSCYPRPYGCILYCTLDVLLKRLEAGIRGVSHIILDDIHERGAKLEFVLGILRDLVKAFPNLRVILMSATMDLNPLKQYFPSCAVVDVPLKTHAVQDYYLEDIAQMLSCMPPQEESIEETEYCDNLDEKEDIKYYESINYSFCRNGSLMKSALFEVIIELLKYIKSLNVQGSILVFLPDCNTISTFMRHTLNHSSLDNSSYLFVPLHSEISPEQMKDVFNPAPSEVTKVILSTDIAETAITPRDVAYVVDSCKTVIRKFSSSNKSVNYTIVLATKYNLEQRHRQASFFQPGFCFHLCGRDCYNKLKNDIVAEAQYTSLHEIILSIKLLRLGNSKQFLSKTLRPPSSKAILDAEELLDELGALDKNGNLTPLGKILARLPVEPQLGKMIILGCLFSLGDISCLLAAHHSVHPESSAPNLEKFIGYRCSDHIAFVNSFIQWQMMKTKDAKEKEEFFHKHNLPVHSLELIHDMKTQLREILKSMGFPDGCLAEKPLFLADHDSDVDMVIALLVMGLYPNISFHKESKSASEHQTDFATSFNSPFFVFGKKICTEEATYKNMTMISVVHLLLFGSRNIKLLNGMVQVDSWISLKMDPQLVSKLVAVRSALEIIINDVAANPRSVDSLSKTHHRLLSVTKALCTEIADDQDSIVPNTVDMEPPRKFRLLDAESWNNSYTCRKGSQSDDSFHNQNVQLFGNNMPDYDKPSDPRLSLTDKYRSSDGHYNKAHDQRFITVGKYSSSDGHYGVDLTQQREENRTVFQSHEEFSRGRRVPKSRDNSDLGYWGHGL